MKLHIDDDFRAITRAIITKYDQRAEQSLVWSDDEYQQGAFEGGWDPKHHRFIFSFYAPDGGNYTFSFTIDDARVAASGGTIDPALQYTKPAPEW